MKSNVAVGVGLFITSLVFFANAQTQGDVLQQMQDRGVMRVGMTLASPPWSFLDDKNQPAGYDVEVANNLANCLDVAKVEFVPGTFENFIPGVQSDRFDIVISGQTVTEARKEQVDFSNPYEVNGVAIFVEKDSTALQTQDDLAGKRIAVSEGSTQETFARENIPNATIKTYKNATLALRDVSLGRADAALFSRFIGGYLAAQNNLTVKPLPGLLNSEVNAMSFKKGEVVLKEAVDACLADMIADGTLSEISAKWLGGLDMVEELDKLPVN